ncbi:MAG: hypothetical protein HYV24_13170 [Deltaproteobacteria bacterium]|nr:hypothetical protein [Deltaproteobacteria bacterium]
MNGTAMTDIEVIMERIRENVKRKKELGVYSDADIREISGASLPLQEGDRKDVLMAQLDLLRNDYDLTKVPLISSHRPISGKLIVTLKKLTIYVLTRFAGSMWEKQASFNFNLLESMYTMHDEIKRLNSENESLRKKVEELRNRSERR